MNFNQGRRPQQYSNDNRGYDNYGQGGGRDFDRNRTGGGRPAGNFNGKYLISSCNLFWYFLTFYFTDRGPNRGRYGNFGEDGGRGQYDRNGREGRLLRFFFRFKFYFKKVKLQI